MVKLEIINIMGQRINLLVSEIKQKGFHRIDWDGTDETGRHVSSGIYIYRLINSKQFEAKQLLLLK